MSALVRTVLLLTFFSIAMGFLEASVVIYLRDLYYPNGFQFPLVSIPSEVALVEFLREAATVIMLVCIGAISGKNRAERFSFFLFCFAVWDIFYYVFLKVFLDWPASFLTEDILFIIPIPWVGPILAPCLVSLTMIILTLAVVYFHERDVLITINNLEWLLFTFGALVLVISFTWDYSSYMIRNEDTRVWTPMSQDGLFSEVSSYVPQSFNWWLFVAGELLLIAGIGMMVKRHRKFHKIQNERLS